MLDEELSEFQNDFHYDEELFDKIKKDSIQEFSLLELLLIDLTFRITNAPVFIEDRNERYNFLIRHLTDVEEVVANKLEYLSERELKYAKAVSTIIQSQLSLIKNKYDFSYDLPNDLEGFGEVFMSK